MIEPADVSPLLKWAGGKRRQLKTIAPIVIDALNASGGRYFEPFLGGAAMALHLGIGERMILNDAIAELVMFYRTVRDEPALVAWSLSALAIQGVDEENFYRVRDMDPTTLKPEMVAARMFFLNRLGFNGMYRVNKAGGFNVPFGKPDVDRERAAMTAQPYRESIVKRKSRDAIGSLFPHKGKIEAVSRVLKRSHICHGDFEPVINAASRGDVVYCDPPYDGTYNSYTAVGFSEDDQRRLTDACRRANSRGATVLISNSNTDLVHEMYSPWAEIHDTSEGRTINSDTGGRGRASCILAVAKGSNE